MMKTLCIGMFVLALTACSSTSADKQRYWAWYDSLSSEQQAMEDQRRHERGLAAMQALGQMNFGRGPFGGGYTWGQTRTYDTTVPGYQIQSQPRRQTNCTSRVVGNQLYTDCY